MNPAAIPQALDAVLGASQIAYRRALSDGPEWHLWPVEPVERPTFRIRIRPYFGGVRIEARNESFAADFTRDLLRQAGSSESVRRRLEGELPDGTAILRLSWSDASVAVALHTAANDPADPLGDVEASLSAVLRLFEEPFVVAPAIARVAVPRTPGDRVPGTVQAGWSTELLDAATAAHRECENAVIEWLLAKDLTPLDPAGRIEFDLAWQTRTGAFVVCEVKSVGQHPEKQMRLGTGQVLHYAEQLRRARPGQEWHPALLLSEEPPDAELWTHALASAEVVLGWPTILDSLSTRLIVGDFSGAGTRSASVS